MELGRRHLGHLAAVAEHRSVTRAAETLGITQPALSRSIQEIERLLGLRCFDRLPQGVVPTSACLAVLGRARAVLGAFEDLEREAQHLSERFSGPLDVGLGPVVAAGSAIRELGRLLATHPELHARLVVSSAVDLLERLRRLELEFFVADQSVAEGAGDLAVEALEYRGFLLCRAGHPILESNAPLGAVTRFPVAFVGATPAALASARALLREGNPALPADWLPSLLLDHAAVLEALMRQSVVLGGSVAYAHAEALRGSALRIVPLPRPLYRGRVGPVRLQDRTLSPAAEALWKAVVEALRGDLVLGEQAEAAGPRRPMGPG